MEHETGFVFTSEFEFIQPCERLDIALNKAVRGATEGYGKRLMGFNIHYYPPAPFGYAAMVEWLLCDEKEDDAAS